jgi:hypothetical protein
MARTLIVGSGLGTPTGGNQNQTDGPMGGTGIPTTQLGTTGDGDFGGAGGGGGGVILPTVIPPVISPAVPVNSGSIKINLISGDNTPVGFYQNDISVGTGVTLTLNTWNYLNFGSAKVYTAVNTGKRLKNKFTVSIERVQQTNSAYQAGAKGSIVTTNSAITQYDECVSVKEYVWDGTNYIFSHEDKYNTKTPTINLNFQFETIVASTPIVPVVPRVYPPYVDVYNGNKPPDDAHILVNFVTLGNVLSDFTVKPQGSTIRSVAQVFDTNKTATLYNSQYDSWTNDYRFDAIPKDNSKVSTNYFVVKKVSAAINTAAKNTNPKNVDEYLLIEEWGILDNGDEILVDSYEKRVPHPINTPEIVRGDYSGPGMLWFKFKAKVVPCKRPTGLITKSFIYGYTLPLSTQNGQSTVPVMFAAMRNLEATKEALTLLNNGQATALSAVNHLTKFSMEGGHIVYDGTGTDCTFLSPGYYITDIKNWEVTYITDGGRIKQIMGIKPSPPTCNDDQKLVNGVCVPICNEGYRYDKATGNCIQILPPDDRISWEIALSSNFPELSEKLDLKWKILTNAGSNEIDAGTLNLHDKNTNNKLISQAILKDSKVYFDLDTTNTPEDYVLKSVYYAPLEIAKANPNDYTKWTKTNNLWDIAGVLFKNGVGVVAIFEKIIHYNKPELKLARDRYDIQVKDSDNEKAVNVTFDVKDADYVDVYLSANEHVRIPVNKNSNYAQLFFRKDFKGVYGQKIVELVPYSDKYGTGDRKSVIINFIPINDFPSITQITFPNSIDVPSFSDLNITYNVSYNSFATTTIDVDLLAKDKSRITLFRGLKNNGSFDINLRELATKFPNWNGNENVTLTFRPYNRSGEHELIGNEYEVSTIINYPSLKLDETIIQKSIYDAFIDKLKFNEPEKESKYLTHLANFGNDEHILISTFEEDNWTLSEKTEDEFGNEVVKNEVKSIILKLYSPLPTEVQENSTFWITKLMTNPLVETVILNETDELSCPPIKGPNFNIDFDFVSGNSTNFESLDNLIYSGSLSSDGLMQTYLSASLVNTDELNIEYVSGSKFGNNNSKMDAQYLWENFVHFSSAKERVDNFVYKVQLIEKYEAAISSSLSAGNTGSLSGQQEYQLQTSKRNQIIQGFDGFEKFLFTSSSAWTLNGTGSITWPHQNWIDVAPPISGISSFSNASPARVVSYDLITLKDGDKLSAENLPPIPDNTTFYAKVIGDYTIDLYTNEILTIPYDARGLGEINTDVGSLFNVSKTSYRWPSTDTFVKKWYSNLVEAATYYDVNNSNYLINNVPQYILAKEENDLYLLFFTMIGQHFDNIYFYTKALENSRGLGYKSKGGISDKLLFSGLKSLSWDAVNLGSDEDLWHYAFGLDKEGNISEEKSAKERTNEIWRRLINNLPYLLKHKGTKRGIHALMACYGIPASNLSIMEFGGPEVSDEQKGKLIMDNLTTVVNFSTGSAIKIPWNNTANSRKPDTIEMFIKPAYSGQWQLVSGSGWGLYLSGSKNSSYGQVKFTYSGSNTLRNTISSSLVPIFNGRFFGVEISRAKGASSTVFELNVKQTEKDRTIFSSSVSASVANVTANIWSSGSFVYIGSGSQGFSGSLDEMRLWSTPLSRSIFYEHTAFPEMINGNHISSSTEDLIFRLDFEYPKDLGYTGQNKFLLNVAPIIYYTASADRNDLEEKLPITSGSTIFSSNQYAPLSASAFGFTSIEDYPYQFDVLDRTVLLGMPDMGASRYISNKVRFESQTLVTDLSNDHRATVKSYDQSPTDSNRIGLFFSPTKELNIDIAKTFGGQNLDNYIGDPSDDYSEGYGDLDKLRQYYFQRIHGRDIYAYINMIKLYEKAMFEDVKKMLPARAKAATGLLIEPHFLERSKVAHKRPAADTNDLNDTITYEYVTESDSFQKDTIINANNTEVISENYQNNVTLPVVIPIVSETIQKETTINANILKVNSDNIQKETTINANTLKINSENEQYYTQINGNTLKVNSENTQKESLIDIDLQKSSVLSNLDLNKSLTVVGQSKYEDIGFGIFGISGSVIRTFYDVDGTLIKRRYKAQLITKQFTRDIFPYRVKVASTGKGDDRQGFTVSQSVYTETYLNLQPFSTSSAAPSIPTVTGDIISVVPVNGYLPIHNKFTSDRTAGMENAYYKGCKNTSATTLDGTDPIETFSTNPNVIKVNKAGRDISEPILEVE